MTRTWRTIVVVLVLVAATGAVAAEEVLWIPAAASNPGAAGTWWTTDLWIMNRVVDAPTTVHLAFLPTAEGVAEPAEVSIEIPAVRTVLLEDVVGELFGESRPGAIRLRSEYPVEARSRTYNSGGDGGTYGQGIPAVAAEEGEIGWALIGAANRPGEDGVRSNLGLYNMSDDGDDVQIFVIDQDTGDFLGDVGMRVDVGPHGWLQQNLFELVGAADLEVANATVLIIGDRSIRGYLSMIDNRSGDGTFVLPSRAESVYSIPAPWSVTATLSFSENVVINTLVYTGEDGEDVLVETPPDGWTVSLTIMSPAEFCYRADGTVNSGSGTVQMGVEYEREGDTGGGSSSRSVGGGAGDISIEDCFDLY